MITKKKVFWIIIFILIIAELFLSAYLVYDSMQLKTVCIAGEECDLVQTSQYAYLFGIKLIYISIFAFISLLVLFIISNKYFLYATIIGALFAIYFIYIQLFVLHLICSTCMIIDSIMILILIFSLIRFFMLSKK